jgi:hypothetical protein
MHTIILPYFCEMEIDRYESILKHIGRLGKQQTDYEFLLAASPKISPSARLMNAASRVAPSRHFACPSQVFGYPEGPSAMFWDCMCHLADAPCPEGFSLWMESDMCPVKPDWLDRLDADWKSCGEIFVMGCVIPQVNRHKRMFPLTNWFQHKRWITQHVNGGACYCRNLVHHMPADFREGLFDVRLGEILREMGGYADTPGISFSTIERLGDDLAHPEKVLLHGYLQDKEEFLRGCMRPTDPSEPTIKPARKGFWERRKQHPSKPKLDAILSVKDCQPSALTVCQRRAA